MKKLKLASKIQLMPHNLHCWIIIPFIIILINLKSIEMYSQTSLATIESEMVLVEGGTMAMDHGGVTKQVLLTDYYISKYETTQRLWQEVMGDNPASFKDPLKPVEQVDWYSCVVFCNELSLLSARTPRYYKDIACSLPITKADYAGGGVSIPFTSYELESANGYRLPLETEWQYAASGGTKTQGYTYSGSNTIDEVAWYTGNNTPNGTKQVGRLKANELGLYDMSGNVYEWNFCVYGSQQSWTQECGDLGSGSGAFRRRRGGYWNGSAISCTTANRTSGDPADRDYGIGLRLAASSQ